MHRRQARTTPTRTKTSRITKGGNGPKVPQRPGDPSKPSSFFDNSTAESIVAAHLGFNELMAFRAFLTSDPCLRAFIAVQALGNINRAGAFDCLHQAPKDFDESDAQIDEYEEWPLEMLGPILTDHQKRTYKSHRLALILARMLVDIEICRSNKQYRLKGYGDFRKKFEEKTNLSLPNLASTTSSAIIFPDINLGPFIEQGESSLEPVNRVLHVLKYLNHIATSK